MIHAPNSILVHNLGFFQHFIKKMKLMKRYYHLTTIICHFEYYSGRFELIPLHEHNVNFIEAYSRIRMTMFENRFNILEICMVKNISLWQKYIG